MCSALGVEVQNGQGNSIGEKGFPFERCTFWQAWLSQGMHVVSHVWIQSYFRVIITNLPSFSSYATSGRPYSGSQSHFRFEDSEKNCRGLAFR